MSIFALKKEKKYIKRKPLNSGICGQAVTDIVWKLEQIKKETPGAATPRESGK